MQSFMKQNIVKPKTLACYVCGREFGTKSLTLHLKSCKLKFKTEQQQKIDKSLKIKLPQEPQLLNIILSQIQNGTLNEQMLQKYNQQARNIHKYKVLPACKFCGRTFNEESLLSHMKACPKKNSQNYPEEKSSYKMPDDLRKPKTLACCVCGRQFGLTSLKIHYPQCKQKFKNQELKKPFKQRNPTPQFSKEDEEMINQKTDWTLQEINAFNQRATENYRKKALVQCQNCKRKFFPQSYQRHLKNCKLINGDNVPQSSNSRQNSKDIYSQIIKKPKVLMCHICGREFGLTSLKIHQKSCAENWVNEQKKRPKNQRRQVPQLVFDINQNLEVENAEKWDLQKISRYNQLANQVYRGKALFPCKICGRKFFEQSLVRHLKYCEKNNEEKKLKQEALIVTKSTSLNQDKALGDSMSSKMLKKSLTRIDSPQNSYTQTQKSNEFGQKSQNKQKEIVQKNEESKQQYQNKNNFNDTIKQVNEDLEYTFKQTVNELKKQVDKQNANNDLKMQGENQQENMNIDRVQCSKCGRKFNSDRINKHQSICKGSTKKKEKQVPYQKSQNTSSNFSQKIDKNKESKIQENENKKQKEIQENPFNKLEQCFKCGKKFMPSKIEKHESKCKDVAFKAKKPQIQKQDPINLEVKDQKYQTQTLDIQTQHQMKNQTNPLKQLQTNKQTKLHYENNSKPINSETNSQIVIEKQSQIYNNLVKCNYCQRNFGADRIQKHQNVCLQKRNILQKEKPTIQKTSQKSIYSQQKPQENLKKIDLVPCTKCGRKFDSQRVQKHKNICKGESQVKRKNDKNLLKNSQYQSAKQLMEISKTTQINKKNNFNIKRISKQPVQKQRINETNQSQILRKKTIKQNLEMTQKIMNQIWDTKETNFKPILGPIQPKYNLSQIKQKKNLPNINKTSYEGGFYKRKNLNQQQQKQLKEQKIIYQSYQDESLKIDRTQCKKCGRKFATERIQKHQEICKVSRTNNQENNKIQKRTSVSQNKQPFKSAQKFYPAKQSKNQQFSIPDSQNIIRHFKEIKNMKINESFIDNQLERELHDINSKRQTGNEIKNNGFNIEKARNTFGGGQKFYSRNLRKIENNESKDFSKSPQPSNAKKWFK